MKRFWDKVDIKGLDECWLWTASVNKAGYGNFTKNGYYINAHRMAYRLKNGRIPDGLCILHKCDVPSCVNPNHLSLGTYSDNTKDSIKKGRFQLPGSRRGCNRLGWNLGPKKLTKDMVLKIRKAHIEGISGSELGRLYNVSRQNISQVLKQKIWKLEEHFENNPSLGPTSPRS